MSIVKDLEDLQHLDDMRKSATANVSAMRKEADALFEDVVTRVQSSHGCSRSVAYAKACDDPVGKRVYAISLELQEREQAIQRALDW